MEGLSHSIQEVFTAWTPEILIGKVSEFFFGGNFHHQVLDSLKSFSKWNEWCGGKEHEILEVKQHKLSQLSNFITK